MSGQADPREQLRAQLRERLCRAPAPAAVDTVQKARKFKEFYASAVKAVDSSRATLAQLQSLHSAALGYYQ